MIIYFNLKVNKLKGKITKLYFSEASAKKN